MINRDEKQERMWTMACVRFFVPRWSRSVSYRRFHRSTCLVTVVAEAIVKGSGKLKELLRILLREGGWRVWWKWVTMGH